MTDYPQKTTPYFMGAIVLVFSIVTFFVTRADVVAMGGASVRGLAVMKEMARQSIPYEVALNTERPMLLEFYANWCTTCQSMAPVVRELYPKYDRTIDFVMLDIDDPKWMPILKKYGVTGVPHFTFLDKNQNVVRTEIGRVPKNIFDRTLGALSS